MESEVLGGASLEKLMEKKKKKGEEKKKSGAKDTIPC